MVSLFVNYFLCCLPALLLWLKICVFHMCAFLWLPLLDALSSDEIMFWPLFQTNMMQLKQVLINNGYSNNSFDSILSKFLNQCNSKEQPNSDNNKLTHKVFYQNQFSSNYKKDERIIKSIIRNNTNCIRPNEPLND